MWMFLLMGVVVAGTAEARFKDQGWRYVVAPEKVEKQPGGAVAIRYDVESLPLGTSLNSVIWYKVKAEGEGSNPSLSIWAISNDWKNGPQKIEQLREVTLRPDTHGNIAFMVSKYLRTHLKDGTLSFLIEPRGAPGFSQNAECSGQPSLAIVKQQSPRYDLEALLRPVWDGSRIENETLLPTSCEGKPAEANLAFVPSKIVSVKNYALDKTYREGKDYLLDGRTLRLLPDSPIPFFKYEDLYHNNPNAKPRTMKTVDGGYMTFSEGPLFNDRQLAVTYEHSKPWNGPVPQPAKKRLPKTFQTLENGKPLKLAVFGDSISDGSSASGKTIRPPFMPRWSDLVADELHRRYGSKIDYINPSLGGMTSDWGRKTVDGLVSFEKPDLVILGFGMNDAWHLSAEQFATNTKAMMASIRRQNPNAEFILLMSFQPNGKWMSPEPMRGYLDVLKGLEEPGVAVADVWSIHGYLLKHKTYWDMTGNHVNHPNDFMVRIYAQTILARLGIR